MIRSLIYISQWNFLWNECAPLFGSCVVIKKKKQGPRNERLSIFHMCHVVLLFFFSPGRYQGMEKFHFLWLTHKSNQINQSLYRIYLFFYHVLRALKFLQEAPISQIRHAFNSLKTPLGQFVTINIMLENYFHLRW